jgi:hypothetical protein
VPRDISAAARAAIERPNNPDFPVFLLTIAHSTMSGVLYLVNDNATMDGDPVTYLYNGNVYTAVPFIIQILSDSDQAPTGKIIMPDTDIEVGETIRSLDGALELSMDILLSSDFDLTLARRTLLNDAHLIYSADGLTIRNVQGQGISITGDLTSIDDTREPWPVITATQVRTPGLYR